MAITHTNPQAKSLTPEIKAFINQEIQQQKKEADASIMALSEPRVFNTTWETYTATRIIGEGGAARVFEANDVAGKRYAVKLLDPSKATKLKVKRFQNEYSFCAKNKHRNVVTMVDYGIFGEKESPFVVMPLYDGSLRTLLERTIVQRQQHEW